MKFVIVLFLVLAGCGYSHRGNEMTGQVKKVMSVTPIICPDRYDIDMSLGVIRNGVGSMSSEDTEATVVSDAALAVLKKAAETGQLVKVTYNIARLRWCNYDHEIVSAELIP